MRKYLALIKGGFLEGIAYKENFLEKYFFISYGD